MDGVLGLPAKSLTRRRRGQAEQHAGIELERAGAELMQHPEQLRTDAVVLPAERREMADRSGFAIGLDAGLDDVAGVLAEKQVHRVDRRADLLAQDRPEFDLVRVVAVQRLAVLGK